MWFEQFPILGRESAVTSGSDSSPGRAALGHVIEAALKDAIDAVSGIDVDVKGGKLDGLSLRIEADLSFPNPDGGFRSADCAGETNFVGRR